MHQPIDRKSPCTVADFDRLIGSQLLYPLSYAGAQSIHIAGRDTDNSPGL